MDRPISLGQRFGFIGRSFKKKLDEMLKEEELTGVQFHVLSALVMLEDAGRDEISQKDLEQATRLSHATMTEIVKRLEKQGFVVCTPSERDRRFKSIRPTDRAAALQREMDELDESIFRELCRGLTAEEVDALRALTDKLLDNIFSRCCQKEGGEDAGD